VRVILDEVVMKFATRFSESSNELAWDKAVRSDQLRFSVSMDESFCLFMSYFCPNFPLDVDFCGGGKKNVGGLARKSLREGLTLYLAQLYSEKSE